MTDPGYVDRVVARVCDKNPEVKESLSSELMRLRRENHLLKTRLDQSEYASLKGELLAAKKKLQAAKCEIRELRRSQRSFDIGEETAELLRSLRETKAQYDAVIANSAKEVTGIDSLVYPCAVRKPYTWLKSNSFRVYRASVMNFMEPGVYVFLAKVDGQDVPLYVGQAINLKNRLSGHEVYRKALPEFGVKPRVLCRHIPKIDLMVWESFLIGVLHPVYNVGTPIQSRT